MATGYLLAGAVSGAECLASTGLQGQVQGLPQLPSNRYILNSDLTLPAPFHSFLFVQAKRHSSHKSHRLLSSCRTLWSPCRRITMFQPDYFIESYLTSDRDDDCEIAIRHRGKAIYLRFSPSQFQESPKASEHYLRCLELLRSGEEVIDDLYEDEAQEWLVKPFEPLIEQFAVDPPDGLGTPTLAGYYFPDYAVFTLDIDHEDRQTRRIEPKYAPRIPWVWISEELAEDLNGWTTLYPPSQIKIRYDRPQDVLTRKPRRVCIMGRQETYFFKPFCSGGRSEEISNELEAFKRISKANLHPRARVCRLHGVVGEADRLLGMLLTLVDERFTLNQAKTLASSSLRGKWAAQVKESVSELHQAGLIWGDVKPDNILIDTSDDAWLIDFGGSYTEGWVDKDKAGTIEGDLHGLARVLEYIA